ncbi:glycoside hydrolase [Sphingobacterium sp. N143]|uniref:glycosyl hydrolase n=1 Tax=Sphingobacterium sp. N143 TaxID=2746727 RepID=UPI002577723D|nr:glycosyl hydrolase [Sphingobacterium sp. N143]MDM1293572.1 glycoside hydrolase [Sphingobacterium sp. N143]
MKKIYTSLLLACNLLVTGGSIAQDLWPAVTKEMKPWTRWWWLGSAVDRPNVERELTLFEKSGFGGVEITPIYGAKGFESKYLNFLSPQWMNMLALTTDKASALGMGVDMNLGTGWPFGGPQIKQKEAATKLILDEFELKKGEKITFPLKPKDPKQHYFLLQALRAFRSDNSEIKLDDYIAKTTGTWEAPTDIRLLAVFSGRTGQKVKRAAPGGEGYTLDHLGQQSVGSYFKRFADAFRDQPLHVRAFFNDSYEVYGANWTDDFLHSFERIKGYKLQDNLLDFAGKGKDEAKTAGLKSDYREVVNALLARNFLILFTGFAHRYKAISKNQAHGSPGNLIDLYADTDIAECETFGSSSFDIPGLRRDTADIRNVDPDPMMAKFATSATNVYGKKYTSSETFTWLTEHFKTSLSQTKPEVEQLFLAGVNHVFYHGTTYSPKNVPFPGWLFYASVNFVPQNSFWDHLTGLNQYITRVQSVLQSSRADNELLVYWPIYDIWNNAKGMDKALKVHDVDEWLHPTQFYKQSVQLQKRGYSFDFATDKILAGTTVNDGKLQTSKEATPYRAIYIPACHYFSEVTLQKILEMANQGATVIFQQLPQAVPGYGQLEERRALFNTLIASLGFEKDKANQYTAFGQGKIYLTTDVNSALETEQIVPERINQTGLKFLRRVAGKDTYYYLVNHSGQTVDQKIALHAQAKYYSLMDPQTGRTFQLPSIDGKIRVQIPSGYSWIVLASEQQAKEPFHYQDESTQVAQLDRAWKVSFTTGGPVLPKPQKLDHLSSWTEWGDKDALNFSGTAAYETTFSIHKDQSKSYLLKLGRVAESARLYINGKDAGVLWSIPFQQDITRLLVNGENKIRIEVANLMANRISYLDRKQVPWRNYHEINFVNINYEDFDASEWKPMESGLIGPVTLWSY